MSYVFTTLYTYTFVTKYVLCLYYPLHIHIFTINYQYLFGIYANPGDFLMCITEMSRIDLYMSNI